MRVNAYDVKTLDVQENVFIVRLIINMGIGNSLPN